MISFSPSMHIAGISLLLLTTGENPFRINQHASNPSLCSAFVTPSTVMPSSRLLQKTDIAFLATPLSTATGISTTLSQIKTQRYTANVSTTKSLTKMNLSLGGFDNISSIAETLFATTSTVPLLPSFALNAFLFLILKSKLSKMLTPEGYYHSLALGTMLWHTLGWRGWTTCVLYLFLGSLVTKVKFQEKEAMGIAEGRGGRRGPENVWGSAATGLLCAAAAVQVGTSGTPIFGVGYDLLVLGYVASLATKLSDTFASEIGKAYGKTTFLITTFERVEPGTEGAVSAEGTAAALVGGSFLPMYAYALGLLDGWASVCIATVAAFLATNAESLIGATLQGKKGFQWMTNEVVNFINTVIGAGIAISLGKMLLTVAL
jgi:uncharacterized protein (TIGR00297 family)